MVHAFAVIFSLAGNMHEILETVRNYEKHFVVQIHMCVDYLFMPVAVNQQSRICELTSLLCHPQ